MLTNILKVVETAPDPTGPQRMMASILHTCMEPRQQLHPHFVDRETEAQTGSATDLPNSKCRLLLTVPVFCHHSASASYAPGTPPTRAGHEMKLGSHPSRVTVVPGRPGWCPGLRAS